MALNNLGLGIVFTASDLASGVIRSLASNFLGLDNTVSSVSSKMADKLGISTARMAASLKALGAGVAIAAAGFAGLSTAFALAAPAGEFQQGIASVGAVTRATVPQLRALEDAALDAGIATQFSPTEAVEGLRSLATAGQTAEQSMKTLIPVLDLAAGSLGQLGVAGAAEAVVGTLNAYQFEADRATEITDKLLRTTQLTNFQTRDFQVGLSRAASAGAQFGQSLDDVLISMGLLRNLNVEASVASTAFRESLTRLAADQRAQNAVTSAGVDVFDRQTGEMRPLIDVMTELAKATKGMTDEERNRIAVQAFGRRGILAFNAVAKAQRTVIRDGEEVTLRGAEAIASLRQEMANAEGTAEDFKDALLDTFQGQKTLLQGTLSTIAIAIGKPFAQVLKPIVKGVVVTLNGMLQLFQKVPDSIKQAFAGGFVGTSVVAIIGGLAVAIKAVVGLIGTALLPIIAVLVGAFVQLTAGIGAGMGIMFALREAFNSNLGGIRDAVLPIVEKISLAFRSLFALFSSGEISGGLAEELLKAENQGVFKFVDAISRAFGRIQAFVLGFGAGFLKVFSRVRKAFEPVFARLSKVVTELFDVVSRNLLKIGEALGLTGADQGVDNMEAIGAVIGEIVAGPLVSFIELFAMVLDIGLRVVQVFIRLGSIVSNAFLSVFQVVSGAINAVIGLLTGNFNQFVNGIVSIVNGLVDFINDTLIESAASAAEFLGVPGADTLRSFKIGRLENPSTTAPAPTASPAPAFGAQRQFGRTRGSTVPEATPRAPSVSDQVEGLLERQLGERGGDESFVIENRTTLEVDGRVLSEVQDEQARERRSRRGGFRRAFSGR